MTGTHMGLSDSVLITQELGARTASSGAQNGTGVDMQGWEGVLFVIDVGAITGSGTLDAIAQSDDNSGFNSPTNVSGVNAAGVNTTASITQVTNANVQVLLEVYRPTERYVRLVATPAANAVLHQATAIRYRRTGVLPPTQSATQRVQVRQN